VDQFLEFDVAGLDTVEDVGEEGGNVLSDGCFLECTEFVTAGNE